LTSPNDNSTGTPREAGWTLDDSSLAADQPIGKDVPAVPSVGTWVGPPEDPARYEILEEVGSGGEGVTYRAQYRPRPTAAALSAAVKQFRRPANAPESWPHDGTWQSLSQQFRVLAALRQNANLVDTREVFLGTMSNQPNATTPFVVMQWIEGRSPEEVLTQHEVPLPRRLEWILQLVSATRGLHALSVGPDQAVVHGDIKPGNCLITDDHRLVLLDLGAATHAMGTARSGLYSRAYAAPEVVSTPHEPRDTGSDTFSVAATAFYLLTNRPAPQAQDTRAALESLVTVLREANTLRGVSGRDVYRTARVFRDLLSTDATRRSLADLGEWAERLQRRTLRRQTSRRVAMASAAAVTVLVATTTLHNAGLPPFSPPHPVTEGGDALGTAATLDYGNVWDPTQYRKYRLSEAAILYLQLPKVTAPDESRLTTSADLTTRPPHWPTQFPHAELLGDNGYRVQVIPQHLIYPTTPIGMEDPDFNSLEIEPRFGRVQDVDPREQTAIPAPLPGTQSDHVIVRAVGAVKSGSGSWGVYCHGASTTEDGEQVGIRYMFMVNGGRAAIMEVVQKQWETNLYIDGTGWWGVIGGNPSSTPTTITGECSPQGLRMYIDDREVLRYRPQIALPPGDSGIFVDESSPETSADDQSPLAVDFTSYSEYSYGD
jgi:serine/threonine protein kinase